ncbi:MAG: hypothetical protein K2I52_02740 [Muribaculaceae bacterium]|nr:hypothetical protein [Muribaculaceae bacterium]
MTASDDIQQEPVTTDIITVSPSTYARAAIYRLAGRWWWVAVAPMAMFTIASLWDAAYLFAAFIWLLMLLPPALMIAYYSYLLKPEAAAMSRPHRVTIMPTGEVTVSFESTDSESAHHPDINLSGNSLCSISEKNDCIELNYRNSAVDLLIIPFSSIPAARVSHALAHLYSLQSQQY